MMLPWKKNPQRISQKLCVVGFYDESSFTEIVSRSKRLITQCVKIDSDLSEHSVKL